MKYLRIDFSQNTMGYREEAYIEVNWRKDSGFWISRGYRTPHLHTGGGGGNGVFRKIELAKAAILKLTSEIEKEGYTIEKGPYTFYEPVVRIEC